MLSDITVVDLETTGLDHHAGRIVELAARRYKDGHLAGALAVLVSTDVEPEPDAVALHGLTGKLLRQHGLGEARVLKALGHLLGDSVLVAHNAAFEMAWLNAAHLRLWGTEFRQNFLCTKTLAVALKAGSGISYSLKQLMTDYGIDWVGPAHRAMPDVQATKAVLDTMAYHNRHNGELLATVESLLNCCGVATGAHYPLPTGLPAHCKEVRQ